ncbi:hypothetical protein N7495_000745 [Penicillium taxi]|uniref:uncharacterized protein n=1 Tax=Penicillium taxi TaxID=168475 RepID=UPI002544EE51|nr:uncharacterized protein N7495_000745 [Penicillium taxi]KAJ5908063.1 hypothetical protein N7495_000745 [Penicillium taxi]
MSGFEVIGVVLGVIPLIISALDSYKVTRQKIKFIVKKELLLNQLIQSLEEQRFFFMTDICLALGGIDLEEKQIIALIDEQGSNLFQNPEVADALKEYLGEGFMLYTNAVARCQCILSDIVANISGLVSTNQWNRNDLSAILQAQPRKNGQFEFTKRIKFSVRKEDLQRQIYELDESTKTLSRLRDHSIARQNVTTQPRSRAITRFTAALNIVQNYAQCLYSAVSYGCIAGCHPEHEARLFLQTRWPEMDQKYPKSLKMTAVSFTLTFSPRPIPLDPSFARKKYEVKVLEEDLDNFGDGLKPNDASPPVVKLNPPSSTGHPNLSPQQIEDLCQSLYRAYESRQGLHLYLSRCAKLCYYSDSTNPGIEMSINNELTCDTLSLADILYMMQDPKPSTPKWTINQQMALAFKITSSIMQLHSTPWLKAPLTSSSIRFMSHSLGFRNTPQPFIVSIFPTQTRTTSPWTAKTSLLELGIMLLEIWHMESIDYYASRRNLQINDSYGTRYEIAKNWLNFSDDNMLPFYLELVTRCIECTFATTTATPEWSDSILRKSVCEHVVKPLWENCPQKLW